MKLIDYIMQTSEEIEDIKSFAKYHKITLEDYIFDSYCPSYFECLKNTPYEKPYLKSKIEVDECKYNFKIDENKCKECWNREVLTLKSV